MIDMINIVLFSMQINKQAYVSVIYSVKYGQLRALHYNYIEINTAGQLISIIQ